MFFSASVFFSLNSFGMGQARPNLDAGNPAAPALSSTPKVVSTPNVASTPSVVAASAPRAAAVFMATDIANLSAAPLANVCGRIPENGFKKMSPTLNFFDDVVAGDYLLVRKPSINGVDQYDVVLNYQFFGDDPDKISAQVTQCFQSLNPYLKGPNGEQMNLRLPLASDPMLPKVHQIGVSEACGYRGEAECWRPVYTCVTALHETMHQLGLVDEYREIESTLGCRSIGPADSLMTDPELAYAAVLPQYTLYTYSCDIFSGPAQTSCLHALDLIEAGMSFTHDPATSYYTVKFANGDVTQLHQVSDGTLFPQQFPELMSGALWPALNLSLTKDGWNIPDQSPATLASLAKKYAKPVRTSPTMINWVKQLAPKRNSILYPAEASTVLYGDCTANSVFLTCEHNAYANHFCGGKPAVCGNGTPTDSWLQMPSGVSP
jgi:hypothetical protein